MRETIKNDPANYLTRDKIAAHNASKIAPAPADTRPRYSFEDAFIDENGWVHFAKKKGYRPLDPEKLKATADRRARERQTKTR